MRIGYFGVGTWGTALISILAKNGHQVMAWGRNSSLIERLQKERVHPDLPGVELPLSIQFTTDFQTALREQEALVESVTSQGIRPIIETMRQEGKISIPIILTSKGIEKKTGLLLPEVVSQVLGEEKSPWVGALSGPSHAEEVIQNMPTSLVSAAYDPQISRLICELFATPTLRIYPNRDLNGVCFGGAMKNIIAIACGISDGLTQSDNAKAALMTRGLHEMRKLVSVKGGVPETLNGLSGMGDLCVTCLSRHSRNYRFGKLIAEGLSPEGARQKIKMAVEGIYACVSVKELGEKHQVALPITEAIYAIIYEGLDPRDAIRALLNRTIKQEHL